MQSDTGPGLQRLRATFEILTCSGFPTQIALTLLLRRWGIQPFLDNGQLSGAYVYAVSLLDALILLVMITAFIQLDGDRPRPFFFGNRPATGEIVLGLTLIPVAYVLVVSVLVAIQMLAPWLHNVPKNPLEGLIRTPQDAVLFGAVAILAGGVREELQRAFVLRRFEQYLGGGWLGLIVFNVLFGAGHLLQGWDAAITTALLGMFWGIVFLRRRSAVAPMISHAGFNTAEILRFYLLGDRG